MSSLMVVILLSLNIEGTMESMAEPIGPVAEFSLMEPLHVAVFSGVFPLLEGPGNTGIVGGHSHDFFC